MNRSLLVILFFFLSSFAFSQQFEELCDNIKRFRTAKEFDAIECDIFFAVGHVLSHSYYENEEDNSYAMESLVNWLEGTEEYHLITGGKILEDCDREDYTMKNIYKICMIDFLFANHEYIHRKDEGKLRYVNINEVREIIYGGAEIFMEYLLKQDKKVINKKLYRGLKLYKEGKFKEYMAR